jgi:hypothetical protein
MDPITVHQTKKEKGNAECLLKAQKTADTHIAKTVNCEGKKMVSVVRSEND